MILSKDSDFMILDRSIDEALIRSLLEDKTIIDDLTGGEKLTTLPDSLYFYNPDIGLLPANAKGNALSFHAAIPRKNRGIKAIRSAKKLAVELSTAGYDVYARVSKGLKHVKAFLLMVGFTYLYDHDKYHIYRFIK